MLSTTQVVLTLRRMNWTTAEGLTIRALGYQSARLLQPKGCISHRVRVSRVEGLAPGPFGSVAVWWHNLSPSGAARTLVGFCFRRNSRYFPLLGEANEWKFPLELWLCGSQIFKVERAEGWADVVMNS